MGSSKRATRRRTLQFSNSPLHPVLLLFSSLLALQTHLPPLLPPPSSTHVHTQTSQLMSFYAASTSSEARPLAGAPRKRPRQPRGVAYVPQAPRPRAPSLSAASASWGGHISDTETPLTPPRTVLSDHVSCNSVLAAARRLLTPPLGNYFHRTTTPTLTPSPKPLRRPTCSAACRASRSNGDRGSALTWTWKPRRSWAEA